MLGISGICDNFHFSLRFFIRLPSMQSGHDENNRDRHEKSRNPAAIPAVVAGCTFWPTLTPENDEDPPRGKGGAVIYGEKLWRSALKLLLNGVSRRRAKKQS